MILDKGDVLLVSHRRLFETDEARLFVGRTIASDGGLVKAEGYSFVRDLSSGYIVKKEEKRVKIFSIASPGFIVYQLPREVNVDTVGISSGHGEAILVDGSHQIMNLSERTQCGQF